MNSLRKIHGAVFTAFLFMGLAVILFTPSCSGDKTAENEGYDRATEEFSDFINRGDFDAADSLIRSEHDLGLAAGDSDRWCDSKVRETILNYYLSRPDRMLASIDSASLWLDRQPETPHRLLMHQKITQAKGSVYSQFQFNADSAIYYLKHGADLAERSGNRKEYAIALANLADAYKLASRLDMAATYYHEAILEADSAGMEPQDYISLYGGLATVYTGLRDFDKSGIWWEKTMSLRPLMIPYEKFNNLNNYGTDYYYRKDYEGALKTFQGLDRWLDSLPSAEWEKNFVAVNLSDCYLRLGKTDSVERLIPRAYSYFTEVQPNPAAVSYLHTLMMRRDWQKGDRDAVERLIAEHPFSDTLRPEMQLLRLEFLTDYYHATGRDDLAYGTYRKLDELEDSIRSVTVAQNIAATAMSYERDTDLLTLRAANVEQRTRIFMLWNIMVVVLLVFAVVVLLVIIYRRRSRRREEKMLLKIASLRTEAIRSRITPHFIYNALNHEINNRNSGRESRLQAIVSLLRQQQFVLSEIVTVLSRELEFTDSYIAISSDNYPGRVDYQLEIEEGLDPQSLRIPAMFIQILVENAFKHAFPALPPDEICRLHIRVSRIAGDKVEITVFNTSAVENTPSSVPGTGLRIIMETIKILREREDVDIIFNLRLNYKSGATEGCLAIYQIPYEWMKIGSDAADSTH